MQVRVAKSAGFCFGVRRAVERCYEEARNGRKPIYTYGPIIHNEEVVKDLAALGVKVIESREELAKIRSGTVIIRSHGVGRQITQQISEQELALVDATCPFVKKIHRIVDERSREGSRIILIGNASHPEVQGICGWSNTPVTVLETEEEARLFCEKNADCRFGNVCVVSQTTFHHKKFYKLVEIIRELRYDSFDVLNTICNATEERQTEARILAEQADAMIVIGGKHSSNTQKLYEICQQNCDRTFYIQTLADLDIRLLPSMGCVGITAGASTPNILIEEVSKQCQK